jgi:Na+-exporting ATPase
MALAYGTGDYIEGGVITAVIVLNVVIGFWQEHNAYVNSPGLGEHVR